MTETEIMKERSVLQISSDNLDQFHDREKLQELTKKTDRMMNLLHEMAEKIDNIMNFLQEQRGFRNSPNILMEPSTRNSVSSDIITPLAMTSPADFFYKKKAVSHHFDFEKISNVRVNNECAINAGENNAKEKPTAQIINERCRQKRQLFTTEDRNSINEKLAQKVNINIPPLNENAKLKAQQGEESPQSSSLTLLQHNISPVPERNHQEPEDKVSVQQIIWQYELKTRTLPKTENKEMSHSKLPRQKSHEHVQSELNTMQDHGYQHPPLSSPQSLPIKKPLNHSTDKAMQYQKQLLQEQPPLLPSQRGQHPSLDDLSENTNKNEQQNDKAKQKSSPFESLPSSSPIQLHKKCLIKKKDQLMQQGCSQAAQCSQAFFEDQNQNEGNVQKQIEEYEKKRKFFNPSINHKLVCQQTRQTDVDEQLEMAQMEHVKNASVPNSQTDTRQKELLQNNGLTQSVNGLSKQSSGYQFHNNSDQKNTAHVDGDGITAHAFVEQTKYCVANSYPNWRCVVNASLDQILDTICIPDTLDVLPNRQLHTKRALSEPLETSENTAWKAPKLAKKAFERRMAGQDGENKFFEAFRRLKLGGILISGFNTEEFIARMIKKRVLDVNYQDMKEKELLFECDALFIHYQLGAFIIETKSCENHKIQKRYKKAVEQLHKRTEGMKEIYQYICGKSCPFKFKGIICMPNADVIDSPQDYRILMKKDFECQKTFRKFWFSADGEKQNTNLLPDTEDMYTFLAMLVGYRSAKFVSLPLNALEISRIINGQEFQKSPNQKKECYFEETSLHSMKAEAVILNKEQLKAVECTEKHKIITGPPGTGKTLILLIGALEAAKMDKAGRVIIGTGLLESPLNAVFKQFIEKNKHISHREITVVDNFWPIFPRNPNNLHDDIFCDELPVSEGLISALMKNNKSVWGKPSSRSKVTGTTTIAITGQFHPHKVASDISEALCYFSDFYHIQLTEVIRGTVSIVNEWGTYFAKNSIKKGHNVNGAPVDRITVSNSSELTNIVEGIVSNLVKGQYKSIDIPIIPQYITILVSEWWRRGFHKTDSDSTISDIKSHLTNKNIRNGSLIEQVNDKNLISIGSPKDALSFDWPIVIYVCGPSFRDSNSDGLIAMSRCIAKLIIVQLTKVAEGTRSRLKFQRYLYTPSDQRRH